MEQEPQIQAGKGKKGKQPGDEMQEASVHSARHQQRGKGSVHKFLASELPWDWWGLNAFHGFTTEKSPEAERIDTVRAERGQIPPALIPKA